MNKAKSYLYRNQKGMATVEALPLLVIYIMLISYAMGLFASIHTAILNNIHARTYAFETFRNRADLTYFRGDIDSYSENNLRHHLDQEVRLHGIHDGSTPSSSSPEWRPPARRIRTSATNNDQALGADTATHLNKINTIQARNRQVEVDPIWIMVRYGICVTSNCGD